ncbi:MAG TPA: hypothetical protein VHM91_14940 [Verrucomicrobiales bacterium]|jgi:hypothetical protein|nr:hypothetical protein [Verrucomicrobiales bacterium]
MKTPVILNLVWAGVAGAAFYTGMKFSNSDGSKNSGQKNISAVTTVAGSGGSKMVNPLLVSKDTAVLDFFKQYGLDTGVPLTPEKMKEAMLTAIRESDPVKSQLMFARLMEELTPENAPAALAMIRENVGGGMESMRYMSMLAYKWGEVDPATAMAELSKGDDRGGRMGQTVALAGWAAKDPQGAIAWLAAYEGDAREKEWMGMSLINGLARSSPEEAMKYALTIKDEGSRTRAAESIAREMIRSGGTEKATAWLATITDADMKKGAFQTVSDQLLRSDPAKAAEFIKQHANEDYARGAVASLANNLAKKDVQQGLDFAGTLTGQSQARAYGSVISEWLDQNKGAGAADAAKYVEAMPAGANKDAGARELARQAMRQDPLTAIEWAKSIQDTETRSETLVEAGRRYMREDQAAASAWLATSGLSAEDQQKVTNPQRGDWGGGAGGFGGFGGGGGGFPGGGRGARANGGATNAGAGAAGGGMRQRLGGGGGGGRGRGR